MFTPKMQRGLGDAVMRMINGVLYVGTGKWLFRFHDPRERFDNELLDIVEASSEMEDSKQVDWRLINARSVDVQEEVFLPHGARKNRPIRISEWNVLSASAEKIEQLFRNETSHTDDADRLDLGELFSSGKMVPRYREADSKSEEKGAIRKPRNSNAESYTYMGSGLVIGLPAPLLEALVDLGFNVWISMVRRNAAPVIGGWCQDLKAEYRTSCEMDPRVLSKSPDGRTIQSSATEICWWTEEFALENLYHHIQYFDPGTKDQSKIIDELLSKNGHNITKTIDALRWQGMSEDMIRGHLERSQVAAWPQIYEQVREAEQRLLDKIVEKQLSEKEVPGWVLNSWKAELKKICGQLEALDELVESEIPFSYSIVEEIAEAIVEVEEG